MARLQRRTIQKKKNHDGLVTHLEPDFLECEVKWGLGSITMNKTTGGDGIPAELFIILKDNAVKMLQSICQQTQKTQQWPCAVLSHSVMSNWDPMDCSLPGSYDHGDSPAKNTGVGCHAHSKGSSQLSDLQSPGIKPKSRALQDSLLSEPPRKPSSGHRTAKFWFSSNPKNGQCQRKFQTYNVGFKEAEDPEIKLLSFVESQRKQGSSRKISICFIDYVKDFDRSQ